MRVFVTGASGHIGSAVVPELLSAGHQVIGLARSERSAQALRGAGADVQMGSLDDLDVLSASAKSADGVIHLAFNHELMRTGAMDAAAEVDMRATETLAAALAGSGKPFIATSGLLTLSFAGITPRQCTEADVLGGGPRIDAENFVIALTDRGVRSAVVRLPPTVHSDLDRHGFVPSLIGFARADGAAGYLGDGSNRWPAVDTRDAARLYRLALERVPAGTRLHAVADEGVPFAQIAAAIGKGLNVPVASVAPDQAEQRFRFLAGFVGLDCWVSAEQTRSLLDWTPENPGLLADLAERHYFE